MPDTEEKISALYDKSKSQLEPPEHLDGAIRSAARKAQNTRYRRMYPAMGLAATLVLGVGVVWLNVGVSPHTVEPIAADAPASIETMRSTMQESAMPTAERVPAPAVRLSAPAKIQAEPSATTAFSARESEAALGRADSAVDTESVEDCQQDKTLDQRDLDARESSATPCAHQIEPTLEPPERE
jgi:hypothetical protein